jgi:hypothetical protein
MVLERKLSRVKGAGLYKLLSKIQADRKELSNASAIYGKKCI